jgi:hypothetical protein
MKRSQPDTSARAAWIREELDWLFRAHYRDRRSLEVRSRWQRLWEETCAGEKIASADIEDVRDVLWRGWMLAMADGDYGRAVEIIRPYFAHPQISQVHPVHYAMMRSQLAVSLLFSGDAASALEIYRTLLESPDRRIAQVALQQAKGELHWYCSRRPGRDRASAELAGLVQTVTDRLRRRVVKKWRLPESATYLDLCVLIESVFPPQGREPLRREREACQASAKEA